MTSSLLSTAVLAILRQIMQAREHLKSQPVCMQWRMMQNPTSCFNDSLRFLVPIFSSVQFTQSHLPLRPHGVQHARPPCTSPTSRVYSNSCPLSWWCHPTISSSVIPFSSRLQSFPASGSFQMSHFLASGGQSVGVSASASILPMNIQDWFLLGWTGWISLQDIYIYIYIYISPIKSTWHKRIVCMIWITLILHKVIRATQVTS